MMRMRSRPKRRRKVRKEFRVTALASAGDGTLRLGPVRES